MHPEKESKYIICRFIEMWGFYVDGWKFSCTWNSAWGRRGAWDLTAEHESERTVGHVKISGRIERNDWVDHHFTIVDEVAEQMYLDSFKTEARV